MDKVIRKGYFYVTRSILVWNDYFKLILKMYAHVKWCTENTLNIIKPEFCVSKAQTYCEDVDIKVLVSRPFLIVTKFILAHQIRISETLPWDRKSYLTHAILPRTSNNVIL